ncbi:hypothetical protein ABTF77_20845, partial [Acinetobacter baumannii]
TLLSTGNETDRKLAYRAFRGRDPDVSALFKRRGFPVTSPKAISVPRRRPGSGFGGVGWGGQTSRTTSQLGSGLRRGSAEGDRSLMP